MTSIYLDNNATTAVDPRVVEAMLPCFTERFGNPASATHRWGWEAEALVTIARERVAMLAGAEPKQVVFTSGATESISTALQGLAVKAKGRILYSAIEHKAVLDNIGWLRSLGFEPVEIAVDQEGLIDLSLLERELKKGALLTTIIGANNEIGVVQNVGEICKLCKRYGALTHIDLVQSLGKIRLSFLELGADFASISGHKIYGPKGVGALLVREPAQLTPLIRGGGQEHGARAGTLNVPGIVGFGIAAEVLNQEFDSVVEKLSALTEQFFTSLKETIPNLVVNGSQRERIPGNLNLQLPGIKSDRLIAKLASRIAISNSSACLSGDKNGSHVLKALGLSQAERDASIRIGIGRFNTPHEIEQAAELIVATYRALL